MKSNLIKGLMLFCGLALVTSANAKQRQVRRPISSSNQEQSWGSSSGYSSSGVQPGSQCSASDRDPVKCKVCAIYGEDNSSRAGMEAVAGVIQTRLQNGHWGNNACDIVHGKGQFVGAWHRLPNNPTLINEMVGVAEGAGANGYLGFRSYCKKGRDVRIGGNCYGVADLEEKYIMLDPSMNEDDVDSQALDNAQMAEEATDIDEG